jgi:hypothetical protein
MGAVYKKRQRLTGSARRSAQSSVHHCRDFLWEEFSAPKPKLLAQEQDVDAGVLVTTGARHLGIA